MDDTYAMKKELFERMMGGHGRRGGSSSVLPALPPFPNLFRESISSVFSNCGSKGSLGSDSRLYTSSLKNFKTTSAATVPYDEKDAPFLSSSSLRSGLRNDEDEGIFTGKVTSILSGPVDESGEVIIDEDYVAESLKRTLKKDKTSEGVKALIKDRCLGSRVVVKLDKKIFKRRTKPDVEKPITSLATRNGGTKKIDDKSGQETLEFEREREDISEQEGPGRCNNRPECEDEKGSEDKGIGDGLQEIHLRGRGRGRSRGK